MYAPPVVFTMLTEGCRFQDPAACKRQTIPVSVQVRFERLVVGAQQTAGGIRRVGDRINHALVAH